MTQNNIKWLKNSQYIIYLDFKRIPSRVRVRVGFKNFAGRMWAPGRRFPAAENPRETTTSKYRHIFTGSKNHPIFECSEHVGNFAPEKVGNVKHTRTAVFLAVLLRNSPLLVVFQKRKWPFVCNTLVIAAFQLLTKSNANEMPSLRTFRQTMKVQDWIVVEAFHFNFNPHLIFEKKK